MDADMEDGTQMVSQLQSPHPKDHRDHGWAWVAALAVSLWNFILIGIFKSSGVLYIEWLEYYGESPSKTMIAGSLFMSLVTFGAPLSGYLSDKYSMQTARWVVFVAGLTCALSVIASGWINSLDGIIVLFGFVPGAMSAAIDTPVLSLLTKYFKKRRSLAGGIGFSGSSIGGLVMPLIISLSTEAYGRSGTMLIIGGLYLHVLVVAAAMYPVPSKWSEIPPQIMTIEVSSEAQEMSKDQPLTKETSQRSTCRSCFGVVKDYMAFLNTPGLASTMASAVCFSFAYYNQFVILPSLAHQRGMSKLDASSLVAYASITELFARIAISIIGDKLGPRKDFILFVTCSISLVTGICASLLPSTAFLRAYAVLFGVFGGAISPLLIPMTVELVHLDRIGTVTGLFPLLTGLGTSVGLPVLGVIADFAKSYQPCLLLCSSFYGLGLIFLAIHRFTKSRLAKQKANGL